MDEKKPVKKQVKKKSQTSKKKTVSHKNNSLQDTRKEATQKKKLTFKDICTSYITLWIVFILLLLFVIVMGVLIYQKSKLGNEEAFANMKVPILKVGEEVEFGINAYTLSVTDEYIIKISNHRKEDINKEEIPYKIEIVNNTDSVIQITKNDEKKDYMKDQKNTVIEDVLKKSEKEDIMYHVTVVSSQELNPKDLINVKISS